MLMMDVLSEPLKESVDPRYTHWLVNAAEMSGEQVPKPHGQGVHVTATQVPPVPQVAEVHVAPGVGPAEQVPLHAPVINVDVHWAPGVAPAAQNPWHPVTRFRFVAVQARSFLVPPGHTPPQSASEVATVHGRWGFDVVPEQALVGKGTLVEAGRTRGSSVPAAAHLATHATPLGAQSKAARHGFPMLIPPLHTVRDGAIPLTHGQGVQIPPPQSWSEAQLMSGVDPPTQNPWQAASDVLVQTVPSRGPP